MILFEKVCFARDDDPVKGKAAYPAAGDHPRQDITHNDKGSTAAAALPFRDLSFHIHEGQRILIQGPSGCGKTTLLRLIMGLEKPQAGTITVGTDHVSAVFQEHRLLPYLTAAGNCALFSPDRDRIPEILRDLGLAEAADAYPSSLSGGMARRVSIARALAHPAGLYLFDEPFTGLDDDNIRRTAAVINRITEGRTVLLVTHRPEAAALLRCDIPLEALVR